MKSRNAFQLSTVLYVYQCFNSILYPPFRPAECTPVNKLYRYSIFKLLIRSKFCVIHIRYDSRFLKRASTILFSIWIHVGHDNDGHLTVEMKVSPERDRSIKASGWLVIGGNRGEASPSSPAKKTGTSGRPLQAKPSYRPWAGELAKGGNPGALPLSPFVSLRTSVRHRQYCPATRLASGQYSGSHPSDRHRTRFHAACHS